MLEMIWWKNLILSQARKQKGHHRANFESSLLGKLNEWLKHQKRVAKEKSRAVGEAFEPTWNLSWQRCCSICFDGFSVSHLDWRCLCRLLKSASVYNTPLRHLCLAWKRLFTEGEGESMINDNLSKAIKSTLKQINTSNAAAADKADWGGRKPSSRASWLIAIWCGEAIHICKYK